MTGENGVPDTPDWDVHRVIRVTREEFDWIMSDDDEHPWTVRSREGLERLVRAVADDDESHITRGTN